MSASRAVGIASEGCPNCGYIPRMSPCPDCGNSIATQPTREESVDPPTTIDVVETGSRPIVFVAPTDSDARGDGDVGGERGRSKPADEVSPTLPGGISRGSKSVALFVLIAVCLLSAALWLAQSQREATLLSDFLEITPPLTEPDYIDEWALQHLQVGSVDKVKLRIKLCRAELQAAFARLQSRFDESPAQWAYLAGLANIAQALGSEDLSMLELSADLNAQIGVANEVRGLRGRSTSLALARALLVRCAQLTIAQDSKDRLRRKIENLDTVMRQ